MIHLDTGVETYICVPNGGQKLFFQFAQNLGNDILHLFIFPTFRSACTGYGYTVRSMELRQNCYRVSTCFQCSYGDLSPPVELLMVFRRFYTHQGQEIYSPRHLPGHVFNTMRVRRVVGGKKRRHFFLAE